MAEYLVRTDREEKKTYIVQLGENPKNIGLIYTDFKLLPETRDISLEDIVDPDTKKTMAKLEINKETNLVAVKRKRKYLSQYDIKGRYYVGKNIIAEKCKKANKRSLLAKEEYKKLEEMGVTHAYFLPKSDVTSVFCFEKDGEFSSLVYTKDDSLDSMLKALPLVFADTIEKQDYIFEFMRK